MMTVVVVVVVLTLLGVAMSVKQQEKVDKRALGWTPTQIHLSWTNSTTEMAVTWVSWWAGSMTLVKYGVSGSGSFNASVSGVATEFVDPSSFFGTTRYIHRAVMTGLTPGASYDYYVEDLTYVGVSGTHTFTARRIDNAWQQKFAVFGDFGYFNAESLSLLKDLMPRYDAVVHNGDFAYNMVDDDGFRADFWFEMLEPVMASKAYMASPGNHEAAANFSHYRHRFSMPMREKKENLYWSLDVGMVHFIAFDTELYWFDHRDRQTEMEDWLRADIAAANLNRDAVPWIVAFGHRPLYCTRTTDDSNDECNPRFNRQRIHLEDIFCKGGVDLVIGAHMHDYERTLPVYKGKVVDMANDPFYNPPVPVYVLSGAAGCQEDLDRYSNNSMQPWTAYRNSEYGIGLMTVWNATTLTYAQHLAKNPSTDPPVDQFTLIRSRRNAPHPMCH
jgi:hypothetical protein